jgi:hypothetical protein
MLIPILAIAGVFAFIVLISVVFVKFGLDETPRAFVSLESRFLKVVRDFKTNVTSPVSDDAVEDKNRFM